MARDEEHGKFESAAVEYRDPVRLLQVDAFEDQQRWKRAFDAQVPDARRRYEELKARRAARATTAKKPSER